MHRISVLVGKYLKFYVLGINNEFFHVDAAVPEVIQSLGARRSYLRLQVLHAFNKTYAPSSAACGSLYHKRKSYFLRKPFSFLHCGDSPVAAGYNGYSRLFHGRLCGSLVSKHLNRFGRRADKGYPALSAVPRKRGVLGQKSEAGVNGVRACCLAGGNDRLFVQIAVLCGGSAYTYRFVGDLGMKSVPVCGGKYRHGLKTQFPARSYYAYRYFSAVCDKYLFKHNYSILSGKYGRSRPVNPSD